MELQKIVLNQERNVTLTAILQPVGGEFKKVSKRPAVLVLPGGAYQMCSDIEAEPVAFEYLKAGFKAFVLRYSLKEFAKWPNPLEDYEQAMELIAAKEDEWNVCTDRIAVVGFSAGGHLAACAATMSKIRPRAAILGYPAITEEICAICESSLPLPYKHVDEKTCPCFIVAARDDKVVPIENEIAFQKALSDQGVSFETHIYSFGGHGFSTAEEHLYAGAHSRRLRNWVAESVGWLGEVWGEFNADGFGEPSFGRAVNGNSEKYLSIDCTVRFLRDYSEEVVELLNEEFSLMDTVFANGFINKMMGYLGRWFTLKDILQMVGYSSEKLQNTNDKLKNIENVKNRRK